MEAFSLMATIALNSRGFENSLKSAGEGVAGLAKRLVSTQLVMKGVEAGFDAIKKVVSGGIEAYADYEQLVGGVQTLFGTASNQVQRYANEAYKTAGLSANQYMETVTSFSASLINGLDKDVDQAAELANAAVIDMSDNANKMGTDMQSIQNAYMGFAKGNFTMLDNLKLGYGGTKTEMVRLINDSGVMEKKIKSIDEVSFADMIKAIHAVQEQMGITGTTAAEAADTISGSRSSLYAAFQNLLTFATDGTQPEQLQKSQDAFVSSFAAYFNENLAPKIEDGLKGSADIFAAIASAILTIPTDTAGNFLSAGLIGGSGLLDSLSDVVGWLFDQISGALSNPQVTEEDARTFGESVGNFIGTFLQEGITHLPEMVFGLFDFGVNLATGILEGVINGLIDENPGAEIIGEIQDQMQTEVDNAEYDWIQADSLIGWLDDLKEQYGEAASDMPEWKQAMDELIELGPDWKYFFDQETGGLKESTKAMRDYNDEQKRMRIEAAMRKALEEKETAINELKAKRSAAEGLIVSNTRRLDNAGNEMIDIFNQVLKAMGLEGSSVTSQMSPEDFGKVVSQLAQKGGASQSDVEMYTELIQGIAQNNGIGYDTLLDVFNYFDSMGWLDLSNIKIKRKSGEETDAGHLLEVEERIHVEAQNAVDNAQKTVKEAEDQLLYLEEDFRMQKEAVEQEFGIDLDEERPTETVELPSETKKEVGKSVSLRTSEDESQTENAYLGSRPAPQGGYTVEEAQAMWEQTRNSGAVRESVDQMTTSQQTEAAKTREVMNSAQAASDATVEAVAGLGDRIEEAAANGVSRGMEGVTVNMDGQKVGEITSGYQADSARTHQYDGGEG